MSVFSRRTRRISGAATLFTVLLTLAACGGGGDNPGTCQGSEAVCHGSGSNNGSSGTPSPGNAEAILSGKIPSSSVAGMCTESLQRQFVRSYLDEVYLWADEVPAVNSLGYSVSDYFYSLLATTPDSHGLPKDRFSFVVSTADADSFSTGAAYDYGAVLVRDALDRTRIARLIPGSPAEGAGLQRGGEIVSVTASTHETWYPNVPGARVTFVYRDSPSAPTRSVTLTTAAVQDDPVPMRTVLASPGGRRVGYLQFHDHSEGAQDKLIPAIVSLTSQGIQDLVLDMRYNSGGYVYTATTLASMVTGPQNDGKIFEQLRYSSRRNIPLEETTVRFSGRVQYGERLYPTGAALPRLSLKRVYVLTSGATCSASEAVVNGLRGVDIEVVLVGETTCGKPYGFTRQDNCGLALFPIEFQGFNGKNYGDYANGMPPTCAAPDDLGHALGDPAEGMLGVALRHADTGNCTPGGAALARVTSAGTTRGLALRLEKPHPGRLAVPTRP